MASVSSSPRSLGYVYLVRYTPPVIRLGELLIIHRGDWVVMIPSGRIHVHMENLNVQDANLLDCNRTR
jgi:hypothetical protein